MHIGSDRDAVNDTSYAIYGSNDEKRSSIAKCSFCLMTFQVVTDIMDGILLEKHHACLETEDAMDNIKLYMGHEMKRKNQD